MSLLCNFFFFAHSQSQKNHTSQNVFRRQNRHYCYFCRRGGPRLCLQVLFGASIQGPSPLCRDDLHRTKSALFCHVQAQHQRQRRRKSALLLFAVHLHRHLPPSPNPSRRPTSPRPREPEFERLKKLLKKNFNLKKKNQGRRNGQD